jgi:hypothetical protein
VNQHAAVIALLIVVFAVVVVVAFLVARKRRTQQLKERFGPEYDRVVRREGNVRNGESVLAFRAKRREQFALRPLSPDDRSTYESRWNDLQGKFVDDPKGAVSVADQLVLDVMQAEGYPLGDFERRAADISVDHPVVVENYRAAHDIALRHKRGEASTEDLRRAMVHYRSLLQELLDGHQSQRKGA